MEYIGSGRWAKEDAQVAEQTIYDDTTFPWDDFLRENSDQIVVDVEDEDEEAVLQNGVGVNSGGASWGDERYDRIPKRDFGADFGDTSEQSGSGAAAVNARGVDEAVLDVSSEVVEAGEGKTAREKEGQEAKERGRGEGAPDMSEDLKREIDALLGVGSCPVMHACICCVCLHAGGWCCL